MPDPVGAAPGCRLSAKPGLFPPLPRSLDRAGKLRANVVILVILLAASEGWARVAVGYEEFTQMSTGTSISWVRDPVYKMK